MDTYTVSISVGLAQARPINEKSHIHVYTLKQLQTTFYDLTSQL